MVNDYNHGRAQEEEGYGIEEYDIPPEPAIPEPIIPTAMYYELPAGLMAPLVGVRRLFVLVMVIRWSPVNTGEFGRINGRPYCQCKVKFYYRSNLSEHFSGNSCQTWITSQ